MAMTRSLRSPGITRLHHYKEKDSPPQLDSDEAAMTYERFIRCGSAKPVANYYKETDSPPQLDSDEAAMTYERFIRCGSAKPVANYYGAVRPCPAHRYFRPRGWSRLCFSLSI